jgi:hypothetical protein
MYSQNPEMDPTHRSPYFLPQNIPIFSCTFMVSKWPVLLRCINRQVCVRADIDFLSYRFYLNRTG